MYTLLYTSAVIKFLYIFFPNIIIISLLNKRKKNAQKILWSKDLGTQKDLSVIELHTQLYLKLL